MFKRLHFQQLFDNKRGEARYGETDCDNIFDFKVFHYCPFNCCQKSRDNCPFIKEMKSLPQRCWRRSRHSLFKFSKQRGKDFRKLLSKKSCDIVPLNWKWRAYHSAAGDDPIVLDTVHGRQGVPLVQQGRCNHSEEDHYHK
jgi:hypothetical protein